MTTLAMMTDPRFCASLPNDYTPGKPLEAAGVASQSMTTHTVAVDAAELQRLREIRDVVRRVVTERADRLCWRDVYTELADLVGVKFCPELIEPEKMLVNCCQFIYSLRTGGEYKPVFVERAGDTDGLERRVTELECANPRIGCAD